MGSAAASITASVAAAEGQVAVPSSHMSQATPSGLNSRAIRACACSGKKDGIQRVWVDGQKEPVIDRTNVLYSMEKGHLIKHFIFQNFHGACSAFLRTVHSLPERGNMPTCKSRIDPSPGIFIYRSLRHVATVVHRGIVSDHTHVRKVRVHCLQLQCRQVIFLFTQPHTCPLLRALRPTPLGVCDSTYILLVHY